MKECLVWDQLDPAQKKTRGNPRNSRTCDTPSITTEGGFSGFASISSLDPVRKMHVARVKHLLPSSILRPGGDSGWEIHRSGDHRELTKRNFVRMRYIEPVGRETDYGKMGGSSRCRLKTWIQVSRLISLALNCSPHTASQKNPWTQKHEADETTQVLYMRLHMITFREWESAWPTWAIYVKGLL